MGALWLCMMVHLYHRVNATFIIYYFGRYNDYCRMIFKHNVAANFGGAIYVDAAGYKHRDPGSGRLLPNCFTDIKKKFDFTNNTAITAGSALYGGWLDICSGNAKAAIHRTIGLKFDFEIPGDDLQQNNTLSDLSAISSNPSRVCMCSEFKPNCSITTFELQLLPGQSLQIQAVAVGQRFGTVPTTVFAAYENSSTEIDEVQQVQNVRKVCTTLNYIIKSSNTQEILKLYVETCLIPELFDDFDPYFANSELE